MKRITLFICLALLFSACSMEREEGGQQIPPRKETGSIINYIKDLSSIRYQGRQGGSTGEAKASLYLAGFLKREGILPAGEGNTYFQSFPIGNYSSVKMGGRMTFQQISGSTTRSENVLGWLPGKDQGIIVLSAHYDHLGIIGGELYSGANDNASGTALVMNLVQKIKAGKPNHSILFAFWGSEEKGLLGSRYFVENPTIPLDRVKLIINLDSLGNLESGKELLGWQTKENAWTQAFIELLGAEGWTVMWDNNPRHSSDHLPFAMNDLAGCTLLAPKWLSHNHSPQDVLGKIEEGVLIELADVLKKVLLNI